MYAYYVFKNKKIEKCLVNEKKLCYIMLTLLTFTIFYDTIMKVFVNNQKNKKMEVNMRSKLKKGLSGTLAVLLGASAMQGSVLYASAADLVKELTADIGNGDVNSDGTVDAKDIQALSELIGGSAGSVDASGSSGYDVYKDGMIDVRDMMAVKQLAAGKSPVKPEEDQSSETVALEVTSADCCPGEQVKVDVKMIDWDQDIEAVELYLDFDENLDLTDFTCTGDYQCAVQGNELKIYGFKTLANVYRGNIATLTFNVPDTAYGDYDVKIKSAAVYNSGFQKLNASTEVGLIAADVTERPLYLNASYVNSASMRLSWSMPYCSGNLEGYIIYRDDVEIARTADTWYYDDELENGRKYTYTVQAYGDENYLSAKSKSITAMPQDPAISAIVFPDNASVIGGKSTNVKCTLERTVDAAEYSLSYVDLQGEKQTIFTGNDLAFSTADIKWNIKDVPSGDYELTFSVTDKDGATAEKTIPVTVDTTPPEQPFGFDVFEGEKQMQLTWGIASEAKVVGYNIYRRTEDSNYSLLAYVDGRETLEYTDADLEENDVYFYMMCAVDKFGQEGIYSEEKSAAAKGDETAPEITLFLPGSGNVLHHYVTISLKAEDNIGVSSITAYISEDDGETWSELFKGKGSSVNYSFDTTAYSESEVKIKAVAYDYAGNISNDLIHIYAIDNAGPAKVEGIQSVAVTDTTAAISWNDVPDEDFSYFSVRYGAAGDEKDVRTVNVYTTLGVNLSNLIPDTEYTVSVAAVDIYGNAGEYSEPFTFTTASDTMAPAIMSIKPVPGYYNKNIPLTVTAQDDFSTAKVTLQVSQSADADAEWTDVAVFENSAMSAAFTADYALDLESYSDGKIYVRAFAEDAAGNKGETSAVYEYIVDKTAPEAPTAFSASSDENTVSLTWEVYENNIDSAAFSLYRSTEEDGEYVKILDKVNSLNYYDRTAEPETEYFYKLTAIDAAGNESEMSKAVSAKLEEDKEKPEIISVSPENEKEVSTVNNTVSVLASDNVKLSSVTMEYRLDEKSEYKVFSKTEDINNYYIVAEGKLPKAALTGKNVYVRITAADTAGLAAEPVEITYAVNNSSTEIKEVKAQQLDEYISVTWTSEENASSIGYYVYKKVNTGDWKRIGAVEVNAENEGSYSFSDYDNNTAGTVLYKIETYNSTGIKTEKQSSAIQIYTNPEASLECEVTQQQNVEYIYDASGCKDYYGITSVSIDYGDGSSDSADSASSAVFVHKYSNIGIYTVTLTCENEQGLVSVCEQTVEVIERTLIGETVITVKTNEGKPASGISVYIDLGTDLQKKYITDKSGKISIKTSAGIHTIGVYGDGYLPTEKDCTILAGSGNKFDFTVTEEDIVTADFKVERMNLDQIKAAGIDISAPENQHIVEVKVDLTYKTHDLPGSALKYYVNSSGQVVGSSSGGVWGGSWGGGSGSGSGSGGGTITKPVYIDYNPETNEVNTVVTLTVPIAASFLKEFFHAKLTIYNNAEEQYTISDNQVELNLPEGLSLVKVAASDDAKVNFDVIEGGSSKEIDWIIRGDEAGSYDISASYHGVLDKFNEEINAVFSPDEPITVYGETAVSVDINVPDAIYNGQFAFEVAMTNNSPVDVYCPSTSVGQITASVFGANKYSVPTIAQQRIMKDGKYVKVIENDKTFDTLEPGYTYSVVYVVQDVVGADVPRYYKRRMDLIKSAMTVLNNSKIPVSLNVVDMSEFVVMSSGSIPDEYDPEKQFTVFVADEANAKAVSSAKVKLGSKVAYTNRSGCAYLDIPDGAADLTISRSGYDTVTIKNFDGYNKGYYAVTVNKKSPFTPSVSTGGNSGSSGGSGSSDGWRGTLSLSDSLTIGLPDDFPLLGGSEISLDGFDSPVNVELDDEGHAVLYLGNWDWLSEGQEWDHDKKEWVSSKDDDGSVMDKFKEAKDFLTDVKNSSNNDMKKYKELLGNQPFSRSWNIGVSTCGVFSTSFPLAKGFDEAVKENGLEFSGEIVLTISGGVTLSQQTFISVVPVTVELEITDEASLTAGLKLTIKGEEIKTSGYLELDNTIEITPFVGVGITGVVGAGIYGTMSLGLEATILSTEKSDEGVNKISASFELGGKAYLGPFEYKKSWVGSELTIYDKANGGFVWNWEDKNAIAPYDLTELFDESNYNLAENSSQGIWRGTEQIVSSDEAGYLKLNTLMENASGNTSQTIAAAGDNLVMVFLENDSSRDSINGLKLMYSVYSKSTQTWSAPKQVDSNATGDYAPNLYSDGENIWLIYQDAAEVLDNNAGISEWTAVQNIAAAKFETETLEFSEPVILTSDSDVYDSKPAITVAGGVPSAVWISNEDCDYFGTNSTNKIVFSELTDNGWSEPEVLLENLNAVTDLSCGEVNEELCAVYVIDMDNNLETTNDKSLNARKLSENQAYAIAGGSISSSVFAQAADDSETCLYWYQDGNICKTNNLTFIDEIFENPPASLSENFAVAGNRILWSGTEDGKLSNLYESVYDSTSGSWSNAVKLSNQEDYIENVSAIKFGADTVAVMNRNQVSITEEDVETANSIVWTSFSGIENLSIVNAVCYESGYEPENNTIPVDISVLNNSETSINSLNIKITDSNDKLIKDETIVVKIAAGETKTIVNEIKLTNSTNQTYKIEINSDDITDSNPDDNAATVNAGFVNMTVQAAKKNNNILAVTVTNNGTVSGDAEIVIEDNLSGESVASMTVKNITSGASSVKEIDLSKFIGKADNDLRITVKYGENSNSTVVFDAMKDVSVSKPEIPDDPFTLGDVDNDGAIDAMDASVVLMEYAAKATNKPLILTDIQRKAADVNEDGYVDAMDASLILKYYSEMATGKKPSFK